MSRILHATLIALISPALLLTQSHAGPRPPALRADQSLVLQAGYTSSYFPRDAIKSWQGERFRVQLISAMDLFDAQRAMIENWSGTYPDQVDALQRAILANRSLAAALRARQVQIHNIVAVKQAFSGNLTFYLR